MFETVSLGMTWAAISVGLEIVNATIVLQVMHTVLPQTDAIVIPFLLSYITASLSKSERNCTADDEVQTKLAASWPSLIVIIFSKEQFIW